MTRLEAEVSGRKLRNRERVVLSAKENIHKLKVFYSDKNNMAMFCVLPILILIYGGCSSIYCIHKCRQYLKGRKHKRLKEEDCHSVLTSKSESQTDNSGNGSLNDSREQPISQVSSSWTDLEMDTGDNRWSGHTRGMPFDSFNSLPWQVPSGDVEAADPAQSDHRQIMLRAEELDTLQIADFANKVQRKNLLSNEQHKDIRSSADVAVLDKKHHNTHPTARRPNVPVRSIDSRPFEETRTHVNLSDYTSNKSTSLKAADYSRFADCRSIEIIPLSADPNFRSSGEGKGQPRDRVKIPRLADASRRDSTRASSGMSVLDLKEEILARYEAMTSFNMAKKAAEILNSDNRDKIPRKKHIFITE